MIAPPMLNFTLKLPGTGTKKPVKGNETASLTWDFPSPEIADLVLDTLLKDLRAEGFFVQTMNLDKGLSQARKDDISISIVEEERQVTIETANEDLPFVKTAAYEVLLKLNASIEKLKASSDPKAMRRELSEMNGREDRDVLSLVEPALVSLRLKGNDKNAVLNELVDMLAAEGKIEDRGQTIADVLQREQTMSTGMQHGIALPHAKTDGVKDICVAVGLKKEGLDFGSIDGEKSTIFIMVISPKKTSGPHLQFLAAIGSVLKDEALRDQVLRAETREDVATLLRMKKK
jgi:fructose-specific phosphotransferase system IIA component